MADNRPKILIVDDEPNNHRVLERILEPLNLDCVKAISGQQALGVAHRHDFFLILMDVQMPEMDGFESASLIFEHPKTSHIPVIFLTAFARDETFEFKGYASGAVDYLIKPINDEILKSKVEVFLTLYQERVRLKVALKARTQAEQELNIHKEHLEELVEERTLELQESVQHQLKIQRQLIESEKMASLGRLVAGISHELNTPIGVSLTAATYLSEETDEINKAFLEDRIQKDCFIDYVDCAKQTTDILSSNLNRAKELIKNFKLVTVDVSSEMPRSFNVQEYIRTVVQSLKPEIKQTKHQIEIVGEQELIVESYPGTISQILTNLVMNSLLHAYTDEEQGHILISADIFTNIQINERITKHFRHGDRHILNKQVKKLWLIHNFRNHLRDTG